MAKKTNPACITLLPYIQKYIEAHLPDDFVSADLERMFNEDLHSLTSWEYDGRCRKEMIVVEYYIKRFCKFLSLSDKEMYLTPSPHDWMTHDKEGTYEWLKFQVLEYLLLK